MTSEESQRLEEIRAELEAGTPSHRRDAAWLIALAEREAKRAHDNLALSQHVVEFNQDGVIARLTRERDEALASCEKLIAERDEARKKLDEKARDWYTRWWA
jgi:hypothetical protein